MTVGHLGEQLPMPWPTAGQQRHHRVVCFYAAGTWHKAAREQVAESLRQSNRTEGVPWPTAKVPTVSRAGREGRMKPDARQFVRDVTVANQYGTVQYWW